MRYNVSVSETPEEDENAKKTLVRIPFKRYHLAKQCVVRKYTECQSSATTKEFVVA